MAQYEQKPKNWSLFPMSDEDIRKKEDFFDEKGWDLDKVPNWSGKMTLPDGTVVRMEGRMVEGNRGDFFVGTCYIPQSDSGSRDRGRDDRGGRGRDDRRGERDRGGRGGRDYDDRDSRRSDRGRDDRRDDRRGGYDDLGDDIPF